MNPNTNTAAHKLITETLAANNSARVDEQEELSAEELEFLNAFQPQTKEQILGALEHKREAVNTRNADLLAWQQLGYECWSAYPDDEYTSNTQHPNPLKTILKAVISSHEYSHICVFHFASGEKETVTRTHNKRSKALVIATQQGRTDAVDAVLHPPKPLGRHGLEDI